MRALIYLIFAALLAMWIAPPEGMTRYALIVVLIVASAYIDAWVRGIRRADKTPSNVVSLFDDGRAPRKTAAAPGGSRENRSTKLVYTAYTRTEADELLHLLRSDGLRPMLVARNEGKGRNQSTPYDVRLPPREAQRAQPVIELFKLRTAKNLN